MNTNKYRKLGWAGLAGLTVLSITLCCTPGCKSSRLEAGGAYAPIATNTVGGISVVTTNADPILETADAAFDLANTAMDNAFELERKNRALIWKLSPDVKHTLDKIRPQAVDARKRYATARAVYIASPVAGNRTELEVVLTELSTIAASASAGIAAASASAAGAVGK